MGRAKWRILHAPYGAARHFDANGIRNVPREFSPPDEIISKATAIFSEKTAQLRHSNQNIMKKLLTLTSIASSVAVLALIAACQTVATNNAEIAASKKENLLAQAGFKVITVTTPKQQQAINGLAQYRVSAVTYKGKLYYVFPTATKDKIYVGKQAQFNAYKQALAVQPAAQKAQQQQQMLQGSPEWTGETAGPRHIQVQVFDGFGPINPMQGD